MVYIATLTTFYIAMGCIASLSAFERRTYVRGVSDSVRAAAVGGRASLSFSSSGS